MFERLRSILLEGPEERAEVRKRRVADIKSGKMDPKQRVARAFLKAQRQGRGATSKNLLQHYKDLEIGKKK
jgi:hypothetical protein